MPKLIKEHCEVVVFKCPWKLQDEGKFHAFCNGMGWSMYLRMALRRYNKINSTVQMTDEIEAKLKSIGGWPSYTTQMGMKKTDLRRTSIINKLKGGEDYANEETTCIEKGEEGEKVV